VNELNNDFFQQALVFVQITWISRLKLMNTPVDLKISKEKIVSENADFSYSFQRFNLDVNIDTLSWFISSLKSSALDFRLPKFFDCPVYI